MTKTKPKTETEYVRIFGFRIPISEYEAIFVCREPECLDRYIASDGARPIWEWFAWTRERDAKSKSASVCVKCGNALVSNR